MDYTFDINSGGVDYRLILTDTPHKGRVIEFYTRENAVENDDGQFIRDMPLDDVQPFRGGRDLVIQECRGSTFKIDKWTMCLVYSWLTNIGESD